MKYALDHIVRWTAGSAAAETWESAANFRNGMVEIILDSPHVINLKGKNSMPPTNPTNGGRTDVPAQGRPGPHHCRSWRSSSVVFLREVVAGISTENRTKTIAPHVGIGVVMARGPHEVERLDCKNIVVTGFHIGSMIGCERQPPGAWRMEARARE